MSLLDDCDYYDIPALKSGETSPIDDEYEDQDVFDIGDQLYILFSFINDIIIKKKKKNNNLHAEGFEPSSANTSRPKRDPLDLSGKHAL